MPWNWSDAWLLMSIVTKDKKGTTLRDIISVGDYINHSIFSFDELKGGLEKLISIDYVVIKKDRFLTTKKFERDYKTLKIIPKGMLKQVDQLHELLKTKTIDERKLMALGDDVISEDKLDSAYKVYMSNF